MDPIQYFSYLATAEGVSVVAAAGSSGPGWFKVANGAPWMLTVGGSEIDRGYSASVVLGSRAIIQVTCSHCSI